MYAWPTKDKKDRDIEKAKRISKMGLGAAVEDKKDVLVRLKNLEKEE